mmetsp:Transcript_34488/g.79718  ORF Transcript_34488/g.79718 Transcript_34488/m.79718 type:complete len:245 (-) Transcript_34488:565-1299(-)
MMASCRGRQASFLSSCFVPSSSIWSEGNMPIRSNFCCPASWIIAAISAIPSPCWALMGTGSPKPALDASSRKSSTGDSSRDQASPSSLFASRRTEEPSRMVRRRRRQASKKSAVNPTRPSNMSRTRSAEDAAAAVCAAMAVCIARPETSMPSPPPRFLLFRRRRRGAEPARATTSKPAVSCRTNSTDPRRPSQVRRSRVVPGVELTIAPPRRWACAPGLADPRADFDLRRFFLLCFPLPSELRR